MELNPAKDTSINVADLPEEFRLLPVLIFRYSEMKAGAGYQVDLAECELKEGRATVFKRVISEHAKKPSDKVIEAEIESDLGVQTLKRKYLEVKRDYETIRGYLDSLRAKKDMLIQLGADARKE